MQNCWARGLQQQLERHLPPVRRRRLSLGRAARLERLNLNGEILQMGERLPRIVLRWPAENMAHGKPGQRLLHLPRARRKGRARLGAWCATVAVEQRTLST